MAPVRFIDVPLRLWRNFVRRGSSDAAHLELGVRGERTAEKFLRRAGFKILRRNWRAPHRGEIDLVCRDREVLVFVEVKTRSSEQFGRPAEAVDRRKRRLILRAAMHWLRLLDHPDVAFRFDIVEVIDGPEPEIRHITNAFNLPSPFHY